MRATKRVCIENRKCFTWKDYKSYQDDMLEPLTVGKTYDDLSGVSTCVVIINDKGEEDMFNGDRFLTVSEYREYKINELIGSK